MLGCLKRLCLSQTPNYMRIWSLFAFRRCLCFALNAVHLSVAVALAGFKSHSALQVENLVVSNNWNARVIRQPCHSN